MQNNEFHPAQLLKFMKPLTWPEILADGKPEAESILFVMACEVHTGMGYLQWDKKTLTWGLTAKGRILVGKVL